MLSNLRGVEYNYGNRDYVLEKPFFRVMDLNFRGVLTSKFYGSTVHNCTFLCMKGMCTGAGNSCFILHTSVQFVHETVRILPGKVWSRRRAVFMS